MPPNKNADRPFERGNVFIYVFLGVILFAALMFTVNRSTNTMSTKMSQQQARAHAVAMLSYAKSIRSALEKVQRNGVSESDISFENAFVAGYEHTPVAPDKGKIFHPLGGGITYKPPNPEWLDASYAASTHYNELYFPSATCLHTQPFSCGTAGGVDKLADFLLFIFYIKREICVEINKLTGLGASNGEPPQDPGRYTNINIRYQGAFTGTLGDMNSTYYDNQVGGCIIEGSGPDFGYAFFYVLQVRN